MRKYRGLTKEGKWVYGLLVYDFALGAREWHKYLAIQIDDGTHIKVIPKTVGQSTGLPDKNGQEDWIDDIVKTKVGGFTYYRRIFQAESGAFCINLPVIGATGGEDAIMLITCDHENVGNIHENPKLLEAKE